LPKRTIWREPAKIARMPNARLEHAGYWGHFRAHHGSGAFSLFLRAFLPFLCALLVVGAGAFNWRMATLDRELDTTIGTFLDLAADHLQKDLLAPIEDLHFLARELAGSDLTTNRTVTQLRNLVGARKRYANLRLLDVSGVEIARIDAADNSLPTPQNAVTDWSRSNLFSALTPLKDGELYISSFELRTERGKILEPLRPIVRFATPLSNATGQRSAYIVIDLDAAETLGTLKVANPNGFVELLTAEGYWVKARDPALEWGGVLREREHLLFSTRNARAWGAMNAAAKGTVRTENGGFWYRTVEPPEGSIDPPRWKLVLHVPHDRLQARALGTATALTMIALVAAVVAAPFYWWLARRAHPKEKL
jgi:hypothetical protein